MIRATTETPADVVRWLQSEAVDLGPAILGSLSFRRTRCGHENCRTCLSGELHPSHVLYGQHKGRRFAVYVPEDLVPEVRRAVKNGPAQPPQSSFTRQAYNVLESSPSKSN